MTDGESEGGDCDEVMQAEWAEPGGQWTEWGWRNEEGADSTGKAMYIYKSDCGKL